MFFLNKKFVFGFCTILFNVLQLVAAEIFFLEFSVLLFSCL